MSRLAFGLLVAGAVPWGVACNAILGNSTAVVGDAGADGGGGLDSASDARTDRTPDARDGSIGDASEELPVDSGSDAVVELLARPDTGDIRAITSDAKNLYWVSNASGFVYQVSIATDAGITTLFDPMSLAPQGIAVDTTTVYWGNHGGSPAIWSGPLGTVMGSGGVLQVTSAGVLGVVRAADRVLWVQDDYSVWSLRLGGFSPTSVAAGEKNPQGIVAFDGSAYWANSSTGEIRTAPITGGVDAGTVVRDTYNGDMVALAVDSTHVYWADPMNGLIRGAPLDGGTALQTTLATTSRGATPCAIVSDARRIYWLNCAAKSTEVGVGWADLDGASPGGVKDAIDCKLGSLPQGILVDSKNLYWIAAGQTQIHGMAKPP